MFPVDDHILSNLFLDTKRLQQFHDFPVAFAVKELIVGAGQSPLLLRGLIRAD